MFNIKLLFIRVKRIDTDTILVKMPFHGYAFYSGGTIAENVADYISECNL